MANARNDGLTKDEAAAQALALIGRGGPRNNEAAALLLQRHFGHPVQRYLMRHRIPEADAEELVIDVWLKLFASDFQHRTSATIWIWTVARSVMRDWLRRRDAERRGGNHDGTGPMAVSLDEDDFFTLLDMLDSGASPAWVTLCIERALFELERDDPARAEVLRFVFEGWNAREVAIYYGAAPEQVSSRDESNARDRMYRARHKAAEYVQHCRDDA